MPREVHGGINRHKSVHPLGRRKGNTGPDGDIHNQDLEMHDLKRERENPTYYNCITSRAQNIPINVAG